MDKYFQVIDRHGSDRGFLRGKSIFVLRIRFVSPCVKISLHVRKCLQSEDILGHENVSTVR